MSDIGASGPPRCINSNIATYRYASPPWPSQSVSFLTHRKLAAMFLVRFFVTIMVCSTHLLNRCGRLAHLFMQVCFLTLYPSCTCATLFSALIHTLSIAVVPDIRATDYPKHITLATLTSTARTGDLVLCSGEGQFFSDVVRLVTRTPFSHVALLYRSPSAPNSPLLWQVQRPGCGFSDHDTGAPAVGPTLTNATLYLSAYAHGAGKCVLRRWRGDEAHSANLTRTIVNLSVPDGAFRQTGYPAGVGRAYVNHRLDILGLPPAFDVPGTLCSTLVARTLMDAGLLDGDLPPTRYIPRNFDYGEELFESNLRRGAYYDVPELIVD